MTIWLRNNCNTHIVENVEKERQANNEFWSVNRTEYFLEKSYTKCGGESIPRFISKK